MRMSPNRRSLDLSHNAIDPETLDFTTLTDLECAPSSAPPDSPMIPCARELPWWRHEAATLFLCPPPQRARALVSSTVNACLTVLSHPLFSHPLQFQHSAPVQQWHHNADRLHHSFFAFVEVSRPPPSTMPALLVCARHSFYLALLQNIGRLQ